MLPIKFNYNNLQNLIKLLKIIKMNFYLNIKLKYFY